MEGMLQLNKNKTILLIATLMIGWTYDALFYGKNVGISYPLAVICFYIMFLWGLRGQYHVRLSFGWFLLIPILLLSSTYVIYSNSVFRILNGIAIPFLIAVQTVLVTRKNTYAWYRFRFVGEVLDRIFPLTLRHIRVPYHILTERMKNNVHHDTYTMFSKVLIGLLISIPVLIIVIALLASADQVFQETIFKIPNWFGGIHLGEGLVRLFLILFIATYLFSYIWGLHLPKGKEDDYDIQFSSLRFDSTTTLTVLIIINLVYVLFVIIQFSYLFGNGVGSLPDGTTYAEYTRSGFGELVIVTILNFSMMSLTMNLVKEDSPRINRLIQWMLSILIGCTFVMLISAYVRLLGYEQAYGYTYTRVLVHAFLIFLAVYFFLALIKIWRQHASLLKQYIIVALIAYIAINYINIDRIISHSNIKRYHQTGKIDLHYLGQLSYDVVPDLVKLSQHPNKPEGIDRSLERFQRRLNGKQSWQSFNVSKHQAQKLLLE